MIGAGRLRPPHIVVVGLLVAALPIHDSLQDSPGLAETLLLPGLVFEAAHRLDGDELRRTFGSVALLAELIGAVSGFQASQRPSRMMVEPLRSLYPR